MKLFRNFKMTIGELCLYTNTLSSVIRSEIALFGEFGITEQKITDLETMNDAVQNMDLDQLLLSDIGVSVEVRDASREVISGYLKAIEIKAEMVFGVETAKFNSLNCENISQFKHHELLMKAKLVLASAEKYKTELAPVGLTTEYLEQFETELDNYETAINDVEMKRMARENATEERVKAANKLYKLVTNYCKIGKNIFVNVSPAKYNQFVIYQAPAGTLKAPANFTSANASNSFSWDIEPNATSYQLEISEDGVNFNEAYSGSENNVTLTLPDGLSYLRLRARNMNGYGPYTEILEKWYYTVLPEPINVQITVSELNPLEAVLSWDEVKTATEYSIYTSIVNAGAASGAYQQLMKTNSTSITINLQSGKRHYLKLSAKNSKSYSGYSQEVYMDA